VIHSLNACGLRQNEEAGPRVEKGCASASRSAPRGHSTRKKRAGDCVSQFAVSTSAQGKPANNLIGICGNVRGAPTIVQAVTYERFGLSRRRSAEDSRPEGLEVLLYRRPGCSEMGPDCISDEHDYAPASRRGHVGIGLKQRRYWIYSVRAASTCPATWAA
jgi:hypothetical protein